MNATHFKLAIWVALAVLTLGNGQNANAAGEVCETQQDGVQEICTDCPDCWKYQ